MCAVQDADSIATHPDSQAQGICHGKCDKEQTRKDLLLPSQKAEETTQEGQDMRSAHNCLQDQQCVDDITNGFELKDFVQQRTSHEEKAETRDVDEEENLEKKNHAIKEFDHKAALQPTLEHSQLQGKLVPVDEKSVESASPQSQ